MAWSWAGEADRRGRRAGDQLPQRLRDARGVGNSYKRPHEEAWHRRQRKHRSQAKTIVSLTEAFLQVQQHHGNWLPKVVSAAIGGLRPVTPQRSSQHTVYKSEIDSLRIEVSHLRGAVDMLQKLLADVAYGVRSGPPPATAAGVIQAFAPSVGAPQGEHAPHVQESSDLHSYGADPIEQDLEVQADKCVMYTAPASKGENEAVPHSYVVGSHSSDVLSTNECLSEDSGWPHAVGELMSRIVDGPASSSRAEHATLQELRLTPADASNLNCAKVFRRAGNIASCAAIVLETIYRHRNPAKMYDVYPLLRKCPGKEFELLKRVAAKYQVNLATTFPDIRFGDQPTLTSQSTGS
eukprot:TRINITY_DN12187_c1_g1_i1.p1 TRINITY_DN12187_c1_g1~~TRINITY_DN12187_c1_g1_i1.p1  ORF type:complete len:351 (-),score=41.97 TRINITY_DN12187_c1_g1_i1:278-1330(-)